MSTAIAPFADPPAFPQEPPGGARPPPSPSYPNGDHTAYVTAVYAAELAGGVLRPDGSEVSGLAWFAREELAGLALSRFARAVLLATRHL